MENELIYASSSSLEALIATHHMQGDVTGSNFTMANKCLFANLLLSTSREVEEAISPSFVAETWGLMLPPLVGNLLYSIIHVGEMRMGALYPWQANTYLSIFVLYKRRGRRGKVVFFCS